MDQQLAKLEGLAIGLEQRGEKSAAHQARWALAEIERLQAAKRRALAIADERAKESVVLRAALQPFAAYADPRNGVPPSFQITVGSPLARKQLIMQDCYRAREALEQSGEMK